MNPLRAVIAIPTFIANGYMEDRIPRLAASLSYYTVFSIAPLLVIAIAIAGFFFGPAAASGQIGKEMQGLVGDSGAQAIQTMVAGASRHQGGWASLLGIVTLLFGATGVFGELQDSLNTIWKVRAKPGHGLWLFIRTRILSFTMVLVIGFLLLVSLMLSAVVGGLGLWLAHLWPSLSTVVSAANIVLVFVISTILFATIFKVLPDVQLRWSDVWIGAAVTAVFFALGRWAIGIYLGRSAFASSYGAAGSLAVFLIWVYFSAQAFLIGAEFTKAFARTFGSQITPKPLAQWDEDPNNKSPRTANPDAGHPTTSPPSSRHGSIAPG